VGLALVLLELADTLKIGHTQTASERGVMFDEGRWHSFSEFQRLAGSRINVSLDVALSALA
jgi:hypothetical protein